MPLDSLHGGGGVVSKLYQTFAIPWTVALQAPLSMGFPRQEYWSVLPFPSLEDHLNLELEPGSPALWEIHYQLSYEASLLAYRRC